LTFSKRWALPRPLHQLVAHDVQADEKHAVLYHLRADDLGDPEMLVRDHGGAELAPRVDVAAHVLARTQAPKRRIASAVAKRLAVHEEQPHVALLGGREVFLGDHVAISAHRIDHLIQIRAISLSNQEHTLPPGALQRLEDDLSPFGLPEILDLVPIPRDDRPGPHVLREELEVHLVHRLREPVGVVENDQSPAHRDASEDDARPLRPGALALIGGGVVPEHHDVEVVDRDAFELRLLSPQVRDIGVGRLVV